MRFDLGPKLDELRAQALSKVDKEAEAQRLRHITPGAGQALVYEQKRAEAAAMASDPDPVASNYPLLAAEVGITAPSLAEVGSKVRELSAAWLSMAAAIEGARLSAKAAIGAARTPPEIRAAAEVVWP